MKARFEHLVGLGAVLIILTANWQEVYGQHENIFERRFYAALNDAEFNPASLEENNFTGTLQDRTYSMESLLRMYEANGDIELLNVFLGLADGLLARRDDIQLVGGTPITNYRNTTTPTWSSVFMTFGDIYPFALHDAMIIYPMAEFVRIVKADPAQFTAELVDIPDPYIVPITSFDGVADFLMNRVLETLHAHDLEYASLALPESYSPNLLGGAYFYPCDLPACPSPATPNCSNIHPGRMLPLNMQSFMGRVFSSMYRAMPPLHPEFGYVEDKLREIGNLTRYNLVHQTPPGSAHFQWKYWPEHELYAVTILNSGEPYLFCDGPSFSLDNPWEDRSHAYYTAAFVNECHTTGITYVSGSAVELFDENDVQRTTLTFLNHYFGPLQYSDRIDGTGAQTYPPELGIVHASALYELSTWFGLCETERDIFHSLSEVYAPSVLDNLGGSHTWLLGLAQSRKQRRHLSPVHYTAHGRSSEWVATATGDFAGDGVLDFVALRNFDGDAYVYRNSSDGVDLSLDHVQTLQFGSASSWVDAAIGDFDGDGSDDLCMYRSFDGKLFLFEYDSGTAELEQSLSQSLTLGEPVIALGAGDFDENGKDELVVACKGRIQIYKYEASGFVENGPLQILEEGNPLVDLAVGNVSTSDATGEVVLVFDDGEVGVWKDPVIGGGLPSGMVTSSDYVGLKWKGITTGNFSDKKHGHEWVMVDQASGTAHFMRLGTTGIAEIAREDFMREINRGGNITGLRHSVLGKGDFLVSDQESYGIDELIMFRNQDGWSYIYTVELDPKKDLKEDFLHDRAVEDLGRLRVFPNPTVGDDCFFGWEDMRSLYQPFELVVYSITGQALILQTGMLDTINSFKTGALEPGIYEIEVIVEGEVHHGRFLKS